VNKKLIIMMAAAGLVSFTGAFVFAWLTKPAPAVGHESPEKSTVSSQGTESGPGKPGATGEWAVGTTSGKMTRAMTEKQLKSLVLDIQEKIKEYNDKLQNLEVREQRLEMAHNLIKNDIKELNNLRVELASTVVSLKNERDKLYKSRVEIAQAEKANLMSIAATYDRMKPDGASKILTNMSKMQTSSEGRSLDDSVKILHYMSDRTRAKLLAQLAASEPKLAAVLCKRLKQIIEKE